MEIKNKKTGYVFEISEKEGKRLILENASEFEPIDKRYLPNIKRPKTVKEKVMGLSCIKALTKEQIIHELKAHNINFDKKSKKADLALLLTEKGGV